MSALRWHPIDEPPNHDCDMTAIIKCTGDDGDHLLPGPVAWDAKQGAWTSESTGYPVKLHRCAIYHWISENDILTHEVAT